MFFFLFWCLLSLLVRGWRGLDLQGDREVYKTTSQGNAVGDCGQQQKDRQEKNPRLGIAREVRHLGTPRGRISAEARTGLRQYSRNGPTCVISRPKGIELFCLREKSWDQQSLHGVVGVETASTRRRRKERKDQKKSEQVDRTVMVMWIDMTCR
ncbi:hypothetical protein B0H12DRAFT_1127970 [Mycena haematopus]|nr:hypothetical protein B0H12DRAFT_1127970 [Mycena haematopus]